MKNFLLVMILIAVLIGSFCIISYQTVYKVAVKADEKTRDKKKQPDKQGIISRLLNLFKR